MKLEPLLLSFTEAGRLLGVSRRTVYRMVNNGELAYVTISGRKRVTRESVDEILRQAVYIDNSSENTDINSCLDGIGTAKRRYIWQ